MLDPFLGAGTTALVAACLGRDCLGPELSPGYAKMAYRQIASAAQGGGSDLQRPRTEVG